MIRLVIVFLVTFGLVACEKEKVRVTSISFVDDLDRGSGNFDRMVKICFNQPLEDDYYHKFKVVTQQGFKLSGEAKLRPLASNPDAKCHIRNLYNYINRDSPPGARQLIKDYVVPGNIHQALVQVYFEKPDGNVVPISERLVSDI